MTTSAHKTEGVNRTKNVRFYAFVFTGKERDGETGYGYFGARYMDHELMTMWLSVDPMADKYPGISPYAYCAWNPIKLVDPDGEDIWEIDRKGNVTRKEGSDKIILYAVDNKGRRVSQVKLKDEKILEQLTDTKKCCQRDAVGMITREGKIETATSNNKRDIVKLFIFVSQNTDVEWSVYSFRKGKASKYGIGTFQWDDLSPSESRFKEVSSWKTTSMIHSHIKPRTENDEIESLYGDRHVAKSCEYDYFTYMPRSSTLYKVNRDGSYKCIGKQKGYESLLKYLK